MYWGAIACFSYSFLWHTQKLPLTSFSLNMWFVISRAHLTPPNLLNMRPLMCAAPEYINRDCIVHFSVVVRNFLITICR